MSTQSSSHSELSTAQLSGIVEVAQQIAGVAAFIKNEFCRGHLAASMPLYTFMKDSVERLHSYGWPLVSELEPRRAHLPWDVRTMDVHDAFRAMERLADFFERRAIEAPSPEQDAAALAADLRFLSRYTSLVTASAKEAPVPGPLTPPRSPLDGLSVLSRAPFVVNRPQPSSNPTTAPAPGEPEKHLELPESAVQESNAIPPTECAPSTHASSPHDLRPLPGDIDHSGHALKGRRLTRRSWFEDDAKFLELIGDDHKQWVAPAPREYATISGGEGSVASWHYIDASVLGISAVNAIKLEHPLNAKEVRAIDIDILRFVRLMLYDWVGGHLKRCDRKAEKKSLEIIRRELANRAWQKKRNNTSAPHTPELTALPPAAVESESLEPLEAPSIAVTGTTHIPTEAASSEPLGYYPSCSYAVTPDHSKKNTRAEPPPNRAPPSPTVPLGTVQEEPESEIPASVPDLLTPKPDLRSLRGPGETHVDSVLRKKAAKPAPSYIGLNGFSCHNASCSFCMEKIDVGNHPEAVPPDTFEPASSTACIDTNDLGDVAKHVHFEKPTSKVHHLSTVSSAPAEPLAVHAALLQELQQTDATNESSLTSSSTALVKPAAGGMGDMTELLLKSRCAALGLPSPTTTRPRVEPAPVEPEFDVDTTKHETPEPNERDSLRREVEQLKPGSQSFNKRSPLLSSQQRPKNQQNPPKRRPAQKKTTSIPSNTSSAPAPSARPAPRAAPQAPRPSSPPTPTPPPNPTPKTSPIPPIIPSPTQAGQHRSTASKSPPPPPTPALATEPSTPSPNPPRTTSTTSPAHSGEARDGSTGLADTSRLAIALARRRRLETTPVPRVVSTKASRVSEDGGVPPTVVRRGQGSGCGSRMGGPVRS